MARPIDHLVLPVASLTLARSRLTSLGFTVAPDASHPFGTGNCCVFFGNRTYLEPITVLDRDAADQAAADGLVFVQRLKQFTERLGEGFAMLALQSKDAERDARDLHAAGVSAGPVFRFARGATMPDGSQQEIGVALAFAADERAPDATFFACQRINTEALWNDAFLSHPNGAAGVTAVTAVAEDPASFAKLLSAAAGIPATQQSAGRLEARMNGSSVAVVTPGEFAAVYGVEPPASGGGLVFAGIDLQVADLDRAIGYAGSTAMRHGGRIVIPPSPGLAATLSFGTDGNG